MDSKAPSDFGWNLNQTLNQLVGSAETKLSALIAADVAIVILLLPNKPSFPHSFVPNLLEPLNSFLAYISPVIYLLALFSFSVSAIVAAIAYYSRTKEESKENMVSWRWIEAKTSAQYQQAVQALNESSVEDAYAKENYRLSKELRWKYKLIQYSVIAFILGLIFAMASTGSSFIVK